MAEKPTHARTSNNRTACGARMTEKTKSTKVETRVTCKRCQSVIRNLPDCWWLR